MDDLISRSVYQLEEAWRIGRRPSLDTFFDLVPSTSHDELSLALASVELELRLRVGEDVLIDEYLERFPCLRQSRTAMLMLIRIEFTRRHAKREFLDWVSHYRARFPQHARDLSWELLDSYRPMRRNPPPPISRFPFRLGDFELSSRIGQGAFGVVYKAHRVDTEQEVAIKVPYGGVDALEADVRTLLREKKYSAILNHPGIVPVLEGRIDEKSKLPYIAYKLCSSISLEKQLELGRRFKVREAVLVVADIADAVGFAHQNKIMHRDLKPANILPDETGRLMVTDFGLAAREGGSTSSLSDPKDPVGTLSYMAPEQLFGGTLKPEPASDLFSLGVILYELITYQHPFQGSIDMVMNAIQNVHPAPPSKLALDVPHELDRICLKAISKEPRGRYKTAVRFAADLRDVAHRIKS